MAKKTASAIDFNSVLPEPTKELFRISGLEKEKSARIVFHQFGMVDFNTLSVARAEQLVKQGAPWIAKVTPKSKTETVES